MSSTELWIMNVTSLINKSNKHVNISRTKEKKPYSHFKKTNDTPFVLVQKTTLNENYIDVYSSY